MKNRFISITLASFLLTACTEPGETTYIGSATGGVIGAGLGAIIGNQTGDAGGGLAIGAVAGAGAGAAIGNALEAQQKAIRTQDEALERQQKILAAQNAEIQELRGNPADTPALSGAFSDSADARGSLSSSALDGRSFDRGTKAKRSASLETSLTEQLNAGQLEGGKSFTESAKSMTGERDRSLESATKGSRNQALINQPGSSDMAVSAASLNKAGLAETDLTAKQETETENAAKLSNALTEESSECQKAEAESKKAEAAKEGADKLFYLRRAIRLCPSKAIYHKNLADQYLSLGRNEDAKSAYSDAIKLDPGMSEASQALQAISSDNVY